MVAISKALLGLAVASVATAANVPHKRYTCHSEAKTCMQLAHGTAAEQGMGLEECQTTCGVGNLWPQPTVSHTIGQASVGVDACQMIVTYDRTKWDGTKVGGLIQQATSNFMDTLARESTEMFPPAHCAQPWWQWWWTRPASHKARSPLEVSLDIEDTESELTLKTDESYKLTVEHKEITRSGVTVKTVEVKISAKTFFGARHGLETLTQLLNYDEANKHYTIPTTVDVEDKPAFAYRGLMIDTSRQFLPAPFVKQQLRAMSYNKMNTLHWHLSDTASFSVETPSVPEVTKYGAYGPDMYYSTEDIEDIVQYATALGIRVIPEVDIPAHVNHGWQWGPEAGKGELMVCDSGITNGKLWYAHALEPPTGQLNIVNPEVLPILGSVYSDLIKSFGKPELFHLGGDEVIVGSPTSWASCWNETGNPVAQHIVDNGGDLSNPEEFYKLWVKFTNDASKELDAAYTKNDAKHGKFLQWAGNHEDSAVIYNIFMYDKHYKAACPPEEFIPMVWDFSQKNGDAGDLMSIVPRLINDGYEIILANTDFAYLDCGGPGWVRPGGYWCKPYADWFKLYDYPSSVQRLWGLTTEQMQKQVLGGQTLMWAETADEQNFESKVWPRSAALAGSLWVHDGTPNTFSNATGVNTRFMAHRHRMVKRGIEAEALQPLWCNQNGDSCSLWWTQQGAENTMEGGGRCDGRRDVATDSLLTC